MNFLLRSKISHFKISYLENFIQKNWCNNRVNTSNMSSLTAWSSRFFLEKWMSLKRNAQIDCQFTRLCSSHVSSMTCIFIVLKMSTCHFRLTAIIHSLFFWLPYLKHIWICGNNLDLLSKNCKFYGRNVLFEWVTTRWVIEWLWSVHLLLLRYNCASMERRDGWKLWVVDRTCSLMWTGCFCHRQKSGLSENMYLSVSDLNSGMRIHWLIPGWSSNYKPN